MKKKESALFFSYLCAHILQIAFLLLCFAIFAVILYLYDLPVDPVLYAALLCAAVGLLSFILSYLRFHKQFRRLESALLNLPESRDDLPEPSGSTAVCYDEAVRMLCTKLAQSETDRRRGQEENTDYFTMWVHQIKTPISAMRLMGKTLPTSLLAYMMETSAVSSDRAAAYSSRSRRPLLSTPSRVTR